MADSRVRRRGLRRVVTAPIPDRLIRDLGDERRFRLTPPELRVLTCLSFAFEAA